MNIDESLLVFAAYLITRVNFKEKMQTSLTSPYTSDLYPDSSLPKHKNLKDAAAG